MRKLFLNLLHDILRDQNILCTHVPTYIPKFFICTNILVVTKNLKKSGRKSKKWNWICLLVFVIATWANRENYTVNFFHKKIFKIQQKKILEKKMIEESVELSWDEKRELRRKKRLRSFQEIDRYFLALNGQFRPKMTK